MKKLSKLYWIVSAVVTIAGLSVMTVSAVQINKKNQQSQPVTASDFCKAEDLHSVEIAVSYADIQIAPAGNGQVSLTLPDDTFTYTCENGVLKIQNQQNNRILRRTVYRFRNRSAGKEDYAFPAGTAV